MDDLRGRVFTALTGRGGDVSGKATGDVRDMLMAIGGPSAKTQSGIDLTRAAKTIGVSRRTVERWVRSAQTGTGMRPSPGHLKTLTTKARQSASTQAGRRRTAAESGLRDKVAANGARLQITGEQGPFGRSKHYFKPRTTEVRLSPGEAQEMLRAWEDGGEKGFMAWATAAWDTNYLEDWSFKSVEDINLEFGPGY